MSDQTKPPAEHLPSDDQHRDDRGRDQDGAARNSEWPVDWLRQTSPYINTHRGKTFVVWFGGDMFESSGFNTLVHDLTLLSHLGVKLVIVHGMRSQIDAELQRRNISPILERISNSTGTDARATDAQPAMRVTDPDALTAIQSTLAVLRCKLESAFSAGLPDSPMSGAQISIASGNFVVAKPFGIRDGIDFQHTGEVRKVRKQSIKTLLDAGMVVLLSPIAYSRTGEMFNLLSEDIAMHTAIALGADKLMFLHQHSSCIDNSVREVSASSKPYNLIDPAINTTDLQSLRKAIDSSFTACLNGVERSHIVDAKQQDALLRELFTRDGSGLLIDSGDYDTIRVADTNNVNSIMELITPHIKDETLLQRSTQDLEREIQKFYIIEREGSVICCASLDNYGDTAELACLAVHPDFRDSGKASDMLQYLLKLARKQQCKTLFVLSTRSGDWFIEQGFKEDPKASIPEERSSANQRGSKIYTIDIKP